MKTCLACHTQLQDEGWRCHQCGFTPELRENMFFFAPERSVGNDAFPPEAHKILAQLERGYFWFSNRNLLISEAVKKFFPSARNMFELGCGTGVVLEHLTVLYPEIQFTGGELYETGLHLARMHLPEAELIQVDATHLPYESEFDVVGIFDVLEHIEDDELVLKNIYKSLVSGGGLLITVPQHSWLWSSWDSYSGHQRRYSRGELISKVRAAGFKIKWVNSFMSLLLPLLLATRVRFLLPGGKATQDPFMELRLPKRLNTLLGGLCALERGLLQSGFTLPIGASLICVAIKQ